MPDQLWQLGACDLIEGLGNGQFSAEEVLRSVHDRIRARNPALNAIVVDHGERAIAEARKLDGARARGEPVGPLAGVPVTIKDNVDVEGEPTPNGLEAFKDIIAPGDAPIVRNLRRAGGLIVGRTNTPELSMRATTDNPMYGRTYNPWDDVASPGGSSGGAGAAAAAGFGPIHHGNDIGGSLRFPAFACGVVTVKPTQGRVPAYNPSQPAERGMLSQLMSVQGAICREVRDLRLATRIMAEGDPRDPWWVPAPFDDWPAQAPVKVAVTTESHGYALHPDIRAAVEASARQLEAAGYVVEAVEPPPVLDAARAWFDVAVHELQVMLEPVARAHGSETIRNIFEWYGRLGEVVDAAGYRDRLADRNRLTREWSVFLDEHPLVLTPFLMRPLYPWDHDAQSEANVRDLFEAAFYSLAINYLGLPAGVVPTGFAAGLPCGVQIVGRRYREDLILDAMACIERENGIMVHELWSRESAG